MQQDLRNSFDRTGRYTHTADSGGRQLKAEGKDSRWRHSSAVDCLDRPFKMYDMTSPSDMLKAASAGNDARRVGGKGDRARSQ